MPRYKRLKIEGGTYFFTVVTYGRNEILCEPGSRNALRTAIEEVRRILPFSVDAWVLLPDHVHCIWSLPKGDADYSRRWGLIKRIFTQSIRVPGVGWAPPTKAKKVRPANRNSSPSSSRKKHRESYIWQRRFWEHHIRDQDDYNRHCDYIHYNPVKHGWVDDPKKWEYSTIHRFIMKGLYAPNWGDSLSEEVLSIDIE